MFNFGFVEIFVCVDQCFSTNLGCFYLLPLQILFLDLYLSYFLSASLYMHVEIYDGVPQVFVSLFIFFFQLSYFKMPL